MDTIGTCKAEQNLPKLAISFWIWVYNRMGKDDVFHDLEQRFVELKERGFNCIRTDSGAGLLCAPDGTPRGELMLQEPFPGYSRLIRQMPTRGGRCDVQKRVVELFELAKRYDVKVILSSWFYLHTFWFVDERIHREMFALSPRQLFRHFAEEYDRLLNLLKEKGLDSQVAFVEIQNEADGLPLFHSHIPNAGPERLKHINEIFLS